MQHESARDLPDGITLMPRPQHSKPPTKPRVVAALLRVAQSRLATTEQAQAIAQNEATSDQNRAESKYDTRATEAAYLARGQATRVSELRLLVSWYQGLNANLPHQEVGLGALVALGSNDSDAIDFLFVAPVGGGQTEVDGHRIRSVSLSSPLGAAIAHLEQGDEVTVKTPGGNRSREILSVA